MKMIVGIDPGSRESASVLWDGAKATGAKLPNTSLIGSISNLLERAGDFVFAIEHLQCFGMAVGAEVFETAYFIGELRELISSHRGHWVKVLRSQVKMHHCHNMHAKDSNIRAALIDKYGPPGTKKAPGVTYGLSGDMWSAFAIATFIGETQMELVAPNPAMPSGPVKYAEQPE